MILLDAGKDEIEKVRKYGIKWSAKNGRIYACDSSDLNGIFHYVHPSPENIMEYVQTIMMTTKKDKPACKGEYCLLVAYCTVIYCMFPEDEIYMETLAQMLSLSHVNSEDEDYMNAVDYEFEAMKAWIEKRYSWFGKDEIAFSMAESFWIPPDSEQRKMGLFAYEYYRRFKKYSRENPLETVSSAYFRIKSIINKKDGQE